MEILSEADLKEEIKDKILSREFGSINYQTYTTKVRGKEYEYHHLSANWKNPETGKWKTVSLKNSTRRADWFEDLPKVYNALKKLEEVYELIEPFKVEG